jgi:hypothetical protein
MSDVGEKMAGRSFWGCREMVNWEMMKRMSSNLMCLMAADQEVLG